MNQRRGQVLPFTLSEVFTLLFFALALVLVFEAFRMQRLQKESEKNQKVAEALDPLSPSAVETLVEAISTANGDPIPEDFEELVRRVEGEAARRQEMEEQIRDLMAAATWTDSASASQLLDSLQVRTEQREKVEATFRADLGDPPWMDSVSGTELLDSLLIRHEETKMLAKQLAEQLGLGGSDQDLVERMAAEVSTSERETRDLLGQLRYLQGRIGNGLDHPPCWPDPDGRPEYAFRVELKTDRFSVEPIWPAHRNGEASQIPGMLDFSGVELTPDEFIRGAMPVFVWSTQQDPECRHFVVIVDSVDGGKEAFKTGLLTVERFFYKLLSN